MPNKKKVIEGLEHCDFGGSSTCYEKECPYYQSYDCTDELKNDILVLLKEQDAMEPDTDNDAIALLEEQEHIAPTWTCGKLSCGNCGQRIHSGYYCCPYCGRKIKWT